MTTETEIKELIAAIKQIPSAGPDIHKPKPAIDKAANILVLDYLENDSGVLRYIVQDFVATMDRQTMINRLEEIAELQTLLEDGKLSSPFERDV